MNMLARMVALLPKIYKYVVSPFVISACRYEPTCADYAHQAVLHHGVLRGGWLSLKRLGRCHPWGGSGYDPVPELSGKKKICCYTKTGSEGL